MNSLKTGVVVIVLLGAAYGALTFVREWNKPVELPDEVAAAEKELEAMGELKVEVPGLNMPGEEKATASNLPKLGGDLPGASPAVATLAPAAPEYGALPEANPTVAEKLGVSPTLEPQLDPLEDAPSFQRDPAVGGRAQADGFNRAWQSAQNQLHEGRYADALFTLSIWYRDENLKPADRQKMLPLLDGLAGEVVYSTNSHLEQPHTVRHGETLQTIARQYDVPWQLLQKINGIGDPERLMPGTQLKVVRGPFNAELDLSHSELTLMLGGHYAGRFMVEFGQNCPRQDQVLRVERKDPRTTSGYGRAVHPPGSEGPMLHLGGGMAIHGQGERADCIALGDRDLDDIFAILSERSQIVVKR
jgi:hypothetical protein